jgi:hypothetical protein
VALGNRVGITYDNTILIRVNDALWGQGAKCTGFGVGHEMFGYVLGNASISYFAMIVGIVLVSLPVTQSLV